MQPVFRIEKGKIVYLGPDGLVTGDVVENVTVFQENGIVVTFKIEK